MEDEQIPLPVPPPATDLANLDFERSQCLENFLVAILASDAAEDAFAQIIDGLPTRTSFEKNVVTPPWLPEILQREAPSQSSIEAFRTFRTQFQLAGISVNSNIVQAYQNTPKSSEKFYMRLFEVAALAIHFLGGSMYISYHLDVDINPREYAWSRHPHYPVDFYHTLYLGYPSYPYGLLDVVGYWAETQLFGGVVLCEHESSEIGIPNVFIHAQGHEAFQLSSLQLKEISQLCATELRDAAVLPFQAEPNVRIVGCNDFYEANIFRDEFSRLYPHPAFRRQHCVVPMTDDMRNLIKWANEEMDARQASVSDPGLQAPPREDN